MYHEGLSATYNKAVFVMAKAHGYNYERDLRKRRRKKQPEA